MFKQKNLSPKQLAALTAVILSGIIATSIYIVMKDWRYWVGFFFTSFIISYLLIHQILDFFIYRKIKLIYKLIAQTKATKRE
ncbi:MAG: sensor histidine kinase, partial [Sediminibacterium sp.]